MKLEFDLFASRFLKGSVDGTDFDYTELFVLMPYRPDSGMGSGAGLVTVAGKFGNSSNYNKFNLGDLKYPCKIECEADFVQQGKKITINFQSIKFKN